MLVPIQSVVPRTAMCETLLLGIVDVISPAVASRVYAERNLDCPCADTASRPMTAARTMIGYTVRRVMAVS